MNKGPLKSISTRKIISIQEFKRSNLKIDKHVIPNKDHVVRKIVPERISVWTRKLGIQEFLFLG